MSEYDDENTLGAGCGFFGYAATTWALWYWVSWYAGQIMDANDAQTIELLKKEQAEMDEVCEEIKSILSKYECWVF